MGKHTNVGTKAVSASSYGTGSSNWFSLREKPNHCRVQMRCVGMLVRILDIYTCLPVASDIFEARFRCWCQWVSWSTPFSESTFSHVLASCKDRSNLRPISCSRSSSFPRSTSIRLSPLHLFRNPRFCAINLTGVWGRVTCFCLSWLISNWIFVSISILICRWYNCWLWNGHWISILNCYGLSVNKVGQMQLLQEQRKG